MFHPPVPADTPELITATEVARILRIHPKRVYSLPIERIRLSRRCIRWRYDTVVTYLQSCVERSQVQQATPIDWRKHDRSTIRRRAPARLK